MRVPGLLPPAACARLRAAVDAERQQKCDSVAGAPDHQLNLSPRRLEQLIGSEAAEALWQLAGAGARDDAEVFVRRYTADSRPWTPIHVDTSRATINVALSDDASHGGGDLLACYDGAVRRSGRGEGEATVHAATLLHGVGLMRWGVRYSLIVFVGRRAEDATSAADGAAEAEALAALLADDAFDARCVRALGPAGAEAARALGASGAVTVSLRCFVTNFSFIFFASPSTSGGHAYSNSYLPDSRSTPPSSYGCSSSSLADVHSGRSISSTKLLPSRNAL